MGNEAKKVMRKRDYFTDSMAQISINAISILTGQLTYFYTNKVGMAVALAGTILLVSRIADAISDIIMGRIVDNTKSKKGKARPWLIRMLFPLMFSIVLLFTVPNVSSGMMMVYGIFTNIFACAVCFTAVAVPYYVLVNFTTKNSEERGKIGVARQVASYAIGYGITITILPVTNLMGGTQKAWIIYAAVIAVIAGICLVITYKNSVERYVDNDEYQEKESHVSTYEAIKILLHNKNWIIIAVTLVIMQILYAMLNIAPVYHAQYILGNENLYSVLNAVNLCASLVGFATAPKLINKLGMVKTAKIGAVIGIAGCIARTVFPASLVVTVIAGAIVMYATVPMISVLPIMTCNTVEYNKYRYGVCLTGMANSTCSFGQKVGMGLGAALVSWVLAFGGFDAKLAAQSNSTIMSIYAINIWIPLVTFAIMFILLMKCDLDKTYEFYLAENSKNEKKNNIG